MGILVLILILEETLSIFHHWVWCGLIIYGLYYVEVSSLYTHFVESFCHKCMLNFVKSFFCIIEMSIWSLFFNLLMWCSTLIALQILNRNKLFGQPNTCNVINYICVFKSHLSVYFIIFNLLGVPFYSPSWPSFNLLKCFIMASLVARWLRVCLPMQGTRVRALVWEDPTCHGAAGPVSHNYWACASGACAPQQERPR